ncbi:hypothetical protein FRB95_002449 [Tulasnella sp. JGI-2019a]|nr:hypothetical protein FRB95_002449 [Tulasnella sp. JGI-2019a]
MDKEKLGSLPLPELSQEPKSPIVASRFAGLHLKPQLVKVAKITWCIWCFYRLLFYYIPAWRLDWQVATPAYRQAVCKQDEPLWPRSNHAIASHLNTVYGDGNFSMRAADWLGGAIRIPTEVFDDSGPVGEDPLWMIFSQFLQYLQEAFPKVHKELSLTKVNTHGLLYTWQGSDPSLKPILLMNHQDVVPVEPSTFSQWEQPPFSGVLKDGWIWGRGSCDDKNGLIGNLAAVETLLEAGFKPKRTVVLAFGFDEESSGNEGAGQLSAYLKENGPKEFAFILDEGGEYAEMLGQTFALVSVAEKGYLDVEIKVTAPGDHSSVPPKHTTIGILSQLINHLESNPHPVHLSRTSSIFDFFQCLAAHAPDLPDSFRQTILKAQKSDKSLKQMEKFIKSGDSEWSRDATAILGTTQAVDLISGGVKVNALPEEAHAVINHRISTESSVRALEEEITSLFTQFTADRKLSLNAFGKDVHNNDASCSKASSSFSPIANVTISEAFGSALEPAPVTPMGTEAWRVLSGTIRASYQDAEGAGKDIVVGPMTLGGNTDTKSYWDFSRNIFRYTHIGTHHSKNGEHTVNEAIRLDGFTNLIKFYTTLILNADEATTL